MPGEFYELLRKLKLKQDVPRMRWDMETVSAAFEARASRVLGLADHAGIEQRLMDLPREAGIE